jgi:hypothetical protein
LRSINKNIPHLQGYKKEMEKKEKESMGFYLVAHLTNRPLGQAEQGRTGQSTTLSAPHPHPRTWALGGGARSKQQGRAAPMASSSQSTRARDAAAAPLSAAPSPSSPLLAPCSPSQILAHGRSASSQQPRPAEGGRSQVGTGA